ncbi:MAG: YlbF family regulator [Bacillota bacterium]
MSILEKARELGEEIASSKELFEMKESEIAMMSDIAARNLVEEFTNKQKMFMEIKSQGLQLTQDQIKEVEDLEKRVMGNNLIVDFFRKQQNFEQIIEKINEIISSAIAGEGPGCSDECCSSCGGGCGH